MALKTGNGKLSDVIIDRAAIDALAEFSANKKSGLLGEICAFQGDTANIRIALRCAVTGQDAEYINTAIGKCNKLDRDKLIKTCTSGVDALAEYLGGTKYKNGLEVYRSSPSAFEKWCDDEIVKITHSAIYTSTVEKVFFLLCSSGIPSLGTKLANSCSCGYFAEIL